MRKPAANVIGIGCLVIFLTEFAVEPAHGYTLVNWIRTWPAYAPGAASAPAVPVVVPTYPACGAPAPSCSAPAPVYTTPAPACDARPPSCGASLPMTVAPGCGAALPAAPTAAGVSYVQSVAPVVAPAPQVRYRTTWVRVPTTSYRPIVSYDPATGWPATTMQPCTTYTWQIRREPTAGGGVWAPFANLFAPLSAPPAQPVGTYPAAPVTSPGWPGFAGAGRNGHALLSADDLSADDHRRSWHDERARLARAAERSARRTVHFARDIFAGLGALGDSGTAGHARDACSAHGVRNAGHANSRRSAAATLS